MIRIIAVFCLLLQSSFAQIEAGRGVKISVSGIPQEDVNVISGAYPVSDSGTVRLHLIGEVSIAGLSSNAAAAKIEGIYKSRGFYTTPTVQVMSDSAQEITQKTITVAGNVQRPGPLPYTPKMTLYQAIAAAGDLNMFGDKSKILLMRGTQQRVYDLNNMNDRSIELKPSDTIEVKERGWFPSFNR